MPIASVFDCRIDPVGGGKGDSFKQEEVVAEEDVNVSKDTADGLHDVPGQVEVDEIMKDSCLSKQEGSEPSHFLSRAYP